jgi:hypothetical protein
VDVRGDIVGIIMSTTGATIAPIDMTGIEIETKTEIGTGIAMTTETEVAHSETGRIWNEIESKPKRRLTRKNGERHWADRKPRQRGFSIKRS